MPLEIAKLVLEYLRACTSPQLIAGGVAVYVLEKHSAPVSGFLSRLTKMTLSGISAEAVSPVSVQEPIAVESTASAEALLGATETRQLVATTAASTTGVPTLGKEAISGRLPGLSEPDTGPVREDLKQTKIALLTTEQALVYERILNVIWGTQLALLGHLSSRGGTGEKQAELFTLFYQTHVNSVRAANLSPVRFEPYMGFLTANKLIEFTGVADDPHLRLAPQGMQFVSYVQSRYPGLVKQF
jgi:hypothetical protein